MHKLYAQECTQKFPPRGIFCCAYVGVELTLPCCERSFLVIPSTSRSDAEMFEVCGKKDRIAGVLPKYVDSCFNDFFAFNV